MAIVKQQSVNESVQELISVTKDIIVSSSSNTNCQIN